MKYQLIHNFVLIIVIHYSVSWCRQYETYQPTNIVSMVKYGASITHTTECSIRSFHHKQNAVKFIQKLNKRNNVYNIKIDSI